MRKPFKNQLMSCALSISKFDIHGQNYFCKKNKIKLTHVLHSRSVPLNMMQNSEHKLPK